MITIAEYLYNKSKQSRAVYFALRAWPWSQEYKLARRLVLTGLRFKTLQRIMTEPPRPGRSGLLRGERTV